ncbi:uncharacterized protein LOC113388361 [Ctenocephalides felis]|uniref:uncharacterized protein LOC113388361 n=1 Tax=Ctenocephalides felis TaxID=7515 RepID=UPI000E6E39E0|nr:uncharacterized protein LOC113388361 [Ctenocephalides felis]
MARFLLIFIFGVAVLCVTAVESESPDPDSDFPVEERESRGCYESGSIDAATDRRHRKGRRRTRSHNSTTIITASKHHSTKSRHHPHSTRSPLFENQLLQTLEQKALATNQKKNKTSNQHHSKHHHKNGKHKSPEMELEEISRKLDKVPRKYQNLEIININQGELQKSSDNLDKLVKHQHVDVSLIPSEQDFDQLFVNNNKTVFGDGKNGEFVSVNKFGKSASANSVLERIEQERKIKENMFVSENCTVVLAQTGSTAQIHCEVNDVGENTLLSL